MSKYYVKQEPYVDDDGIYVPVNEYVPDGFSSMYRCIITKELFVEAYNKWIKKPSIDPFFGVDDADCWSED